MRAEAYQRRAGMVMILALLAVGCGGRRESFIEGRALDRCNQVWPVCDTVAGCLVGEESYLEGRFPGEGRFVVQVPEPSTVRVHVYVENQGAAGDETVVTWYEDRCRARIRASSTGVNFFAEAEQVGEYIREADLTGIGDHLIEFQSDSQADYVVKVEVIPKRLQTQ